MPTQQIELTDQQAAFVADALASGRYVSAAEVVREGLRLLERREAEHAARLARLLGLIAEAEDDFGAGRFDEIDVDDIDAWLDALDR